MARPYYKPSQDTPTRTLESHQVILRPLVTEKGVQASEDLNQYTFEIAPAASKLDVRRAVEELFDVKVASVKTQTRKGKARRYRFRNGTTRNWKKAIVTLAEDQKIDFY
ncbi:50S ribosomal protein L23 [Bremerella sp. T1]|uniref:50S ribosomal protein L23 n=1 Tax=Bremerella sp. TYQ1 TaxID=3119568 RepID=UPI001CCA5A7C|nr:50S ribosomal protein L23 [Bremerella volcania]UBM35056.1 50S ribosomal protein L23 [Bremerella volcania]